MNSHTNQHIGILLQQVVLDEHPIIKEEVPEPKHEQEEEVTPVMDAKGNLSYNPLNSVDERSGSGSVNMYDPQMISHPQNVLQDIMVPGVPGTSAMPGVSILQPIGGYHTSCLVFHHLCIV